MNNKLHRQTLIAMKQSINPNQDLSASSRAFEEEKNLAKEIRIRRI